MPIIQIAGFTDGLPSDDGKAIRFDIVPREGDRLTVEMPTKGIGNLVAFLCGLAQDAGQQTGEDPPELFDGTLIEATALALAEGRSPQEAVIAASVGPFAIGIAVSTADLAILRDELNALDLPKHGPH